MIDEDLGWDAYGGSSSNGYNSAGERDTASLNNLAMAIHNGSYRGENDSRWSRSEDGYSSFGSESGGGSYGDNYASFGSGFNTKQTIRGAIQNHRGLVGASTQFNTKSTGLVGRNEITGGLLSSRYQNLPHSPVDYTNSLGDKLRNASRNNVSSGRMSPSGTPEEVAAWDRAFKQGVLDRGDASAKKNLANAGIDVALSVAGGPLASRVYGALGGGYPGAIGGSVVMAGLGSAGQYAADKLTNPKISENTDKYTKMGYEAGIKEMEHNLKEKRGLLGDVAQAIGSIGAGLVHPFGSVGANLIGNNIRDRANYKEFLEENKHVKEYADKLARISEEEKALSEKMEKERMYKEMYGNDKPIPSTHGILNSMSKRLKPAKEPQQPTLPYYAIPALTNLWNNVIIK